jgi:hypothetical protein
MDLARLYAVIAASGAAVIIWVCSADALIPPLGAEDFAHFADLDWSPRTQKNLSSLPKLAKSRPCGQRRRKNAEFTSKHLLRLLLITTAHNVSYEL